ncbi:MAG TPA: hypothetical protein VLC92_10570 [Rhodocyclaceae bacterium]|nr:hypothetical protein [Rhodocyclaceae bacterium]
MKLGNDRKSLCVWSGKLNVRIFLTPAPCISDKSRRVLRRIRTLVHEKTLIKLGPFEEISAINNSFIFAKIVKREASNALHRTSQRGLATGDFKRSMRC